MQSGWRKRREDTKEKIVEFIIKNEYDTYTNQESLFTNRWKKRGIILDFTNGRLNWREIEKAVMYSLIRCAIGKTDIIMIKKNTFKVWQAIKK